MNVSNDEIESRVSDPTMLIRERKKSQRKHTCNPGSAVVGALKLGSRVDNVAAGKDVDSGNSVLTITTTTI